MRSPLRSLRIGLPLVSAVLMAGALLIMSLYLVNSTQSYLYSQAQRDARNLATFFLHVMEAFRGDFTSEENLKKLQRIVENTGALPGIEGIVVVHRDGSVLASSANHSSRKLLPPSVRAAVDETFKSGSTLQIVRTLATEDELLILQPVTGGIYDSNSQNQLTALGVMTFDLSKLDSHGVELFLKVWIAVILAGSLYVLFLYGVISTQVLRPLKSILDTVRAVGHSNLEAQAKVYSRNELGVIAMALNATITRLREVTVSKLELERVNDELVKTQLKMIQSSKMASLGEMAGGVAHEINNPLAVILARANRLRASAEAGDLTHEATIKMATNIEHTAKRIAKIVRSLRWFARDGEVDPVVDTPLSTIVAETVELCQERFKNHQIDLEVVLPPDDVVLACRPVQISQVLLNLLNNAHDAVEELPEKWVRVNCVRTDSQVEISVTDSGHGISESVAKRVMDPFFTTKEVGKGTGLGLSVSQGIVSSHGGTLVLDTSKAHTCFVVRIPMPEPHTTPVRSAA